MATTTTYYATASTYIKSTDNADHSASPIKVLYLQTEESKGLVRFDLSSLPDTDVVTSAKLRIYRALSPNNPDSVLNVWGTLRAWVANQAHWGLYATGSGWAGSGCTGSGDRTTSTVGTVNPFSFGYGVGAAWVEVTISGSTGAALKAWTGFLLELTSGIYEVWFTPAGETNQPQLVVTHYSPSSLEAAGALALPKLAISGRASQVSGYSLDYQVVNASTGLPLADDPDHHTLVVVADGVAAESWRRPIVVDETKAPGLFRLPLSAVEAAAANLSLAGVSTTENAMIVPQCNLRPPTSSVDVTKIAGSSAAATALARDASAILRGAVFVDGTYTATETSFHTTLPARADGYAGMVLRFDDGDHSGVWREISASETVSTYTKITLATALSAAPATGTLVSAGGNKE